MKYHNLNGGIFILILFVLVISLAGAVIAEDRKWEDVGRVEQGKSNDQIQNQNQKLDSAAFAQKTKKLQIPFVANKGQVDKRVKFYAKTFGGTVFVTKAGEIVYSLPKSEKPGDRGQESDGRRGGQKAEARIQNHRESCIVDHDSKSEFKNPKSTSSNSKNLKSAIQNLSSTSICELKSGVALREEFVGARINAIQAEDPSVTKVNYFKGKDSSKWKTDISTYDMVNLGEIYKGIELKLKAYGDNVEKLFYVKPGADTERIRLRLSGGKDFNINNKGELEVETELGTVKFTKPVAYQEINGRRVEVSVEYRVESSDAENKSSKHKTYFHKSKIKNHKSEYGFKVASYDHTKDLIIDPLLASTYLGGHNDDAVASLALDTEGNVYVIGRTWSADFPTTSGAYDTSFNGGSYDTYVSKLDGGLTSLLASTYLGGSDGELGYSLSLDTSGNVYVTGYTYSSDFPTTSGAYDTSYNGDNGSRDFNGFNPVGGDVFVSKLNSGLTSLMASTYLGGSDNDECNSLILDTSGNVYVTGYTGSTDFPTTSGAYDTSRNGDGDAFVSKLDGGLSSLLASAYLGGVSTDVGISLTLDTSGNVYVTGSTWSTDFPTTSGAYDTSFSVIDLFGDGSYFFVLSEVFVSKLDGGLTTLLASTYLGGYDGEYVYGDSLVLDTSGNVYVTGKTSSPDFPTTSGAYDTSFSVVDLSGSLLLVSKVFVSKLDGGLTSLLASTYLGGPGIPYYSVYGFSLTLDTSGNIYVTGLTYSTDFPTTNGAYDTSHNGDGDAFVSKLDGGLSSLLTSTFLGGDGVDYGYSLALDTSGNVYVTGSTWSTDFPTTSGAYDTSYNGGDRNVFVSKLDSDLSASLTPTPTPTVTPTPTPTVCEAESITVSPTSLMLKRKKNGDVTVAVTGADDCAVEGEVVTATINAAGKKRISISPTSAATDASGEATFTITAKKKTGNARVTFEAGDVRKWMTVRVRAF